MAVRDTTVKFFSSAMTGLAGCSYAAGQLIGQLDLILINGFNSNSVTSISVSSGIATVTTSGAHGFEMISTDLGPVVTIAGATPSSLNREWRIEEVTDTDEFTIDVTGIVTDGSASGTITVKQSPLGWTTSYTGTNKRVYSKPGGLTTSVLQVLETSNAYSVTFNAGEGATDVDTLTNSWGSKNYIKTANTGTTTYYAWYMVGSTEGFYIFEGNSTVGADAYINSIAGFFDLKITGYKETDTYYTVLKGTTGVSGTDTYALQNNSYNARIARTANAVAADTGSDLATFTHSKSPTYWGQISGQTIPNSATGLTHLMKPEAWDTVGPRGQYPIIYDNLADDSEVTNKTIVTAGGPDSNKEFMLFKWSTSSSFAVAISGAWE